MIPNYTYFIDFDGNEYPVNPGGDWSLSLKRADEDFSYCNDVRVKFEGELIFTGPDYVLISGVDCCDSIDLIIYCDGILYFKAWWSHPLAEDINEDDCVITVKPKSLDKYYLADKNADTESKLSEPGSVDVTWEIGGIGSNVWATVRPMDRFWEIIEGKGSNMISGGNVVSTFFENDPLPDGTVWLTNWNYVTGHENKLNHIAFIMAQRVCDHTLAPDVTEMNWNELMEFTHNVFNTWWYIDENGDLRVEHIHFWDLYVDEIYNLVNLDNGIWLEKSNHYDFLAEELPMGEQWLWSPTSDTLNTTTNDFDPASINYSNFCPPPHVQYTEWIKEYRIEDLVTDINYVDTGPAACTDLPETDFMLLRCVTRAEAVAMGAGGALPACDWVVWYSQGASSGIDNFNAHLSQANLIANYWMHDRPYYQGTIINLGNATFETTMRIMKQKKLTFPVCCSELKVIYSYLGVDYYQYGVEFWRPIISQYGVGMIYDGDVYPDGMCSLELIFENPCSEGSPTEWDDDSQI